MNIPRIRRREIGSPLLKLSALLVLALLAGACTDPVAPAPSAATTVANGHTPSATGQTTAATTGTTGAAVRQSACDQAVRIGVLLDKSKSIHENVVPQMAADAIETLIRLIDTCAGGEIAVGVLCNVSGEKPFERLFVPPRKPEPPQAPIASRDPFTDVLLAQAAARAAVDRRQADERDANARASEVDRFRARALALVQSPVACTRTDVVSGANRLLTYLAEPLVPVPRESAAVAPPLRVGVLITDGQDNVGRQKLHVRPDLDIVFLLVGGSPDAGALAPLEPTRFESIGSALRWVEQAAGSR